MIYANDPRAQSAHAAFVNDATRHLAVQPGLPHVRRRMQPIRRMALALVLAATACVHQRQLVPGSSAQTVPGHPRRAEETVEGVHVIVDSDAWRAGMVRDVLSPVRVTIENGSPRPLRIAYGEFTLGGANGFRLAALPPYQVAARNPMVVDPGFGGVGFWYAPWAGRYYRRAPLWLHGEFPLDAAYYDRFYGGWPAALPDEEVLRQALPEGVLDPGGHISGFLYFPDQPRGTALTFFAALVDAATGQSFGTVAIPFTVK
ncbi:hypothetical protein [Anaeromyxobacter terrae]|uniref:hypothetical protein n=1 Tax=Anaeromyxobacter terrae TaxID=2925406 RepID=UPI001F57FA02|nr:hypothetical protein [Anaeromyxobacter sp. SG22]